MTSLSPFPLTVHPFPKPSVPPDASGLRVHPSLRAGRTYFNDPGIIYLPDGFDRRRRPSRFLGTPSANENSVCGVVKFDHVMTPKHIEPRCSAARSGDAEETLFNGVFFKPLETTVCGSITTAMGKRRTVP